MAVRLLSTCRVRRCDGECVGTICTLQPSILTTCADIAVGYNTPQSVPDPFANIPQSTFGGLTGSGFRVAGAGGLANIASILGASGITLRPVEDDDSETSSDDSPAAIEGAEPSKPVPEVNQDVNVSRQSQDKGDDKPNGA